MLPSDTFQEIKSTGHLPSPKGAAEAILRLASSEETSVGDLEHAVRADPALAGRLLRSANSVQRGGRRPVTAIHDALIVLGLRVVRHLALGFSLVSHYRRGACAAFDYDNFWRRSLFVGVAMRALLARSGAADPEEGFSCGLLANVGRLALATVYPDRYSALLTRAAGDDARLRELEREEFALDRNELGVAMLSDWGIPSALAEPVFYRENPDAAPYAPSTRGLVLTLSLAVAEQIADVCLAHDSERGNLLTRLYRFASRLSFSVDELAPLCDTVVAEWADWGKILEVGGSSLPCFAEITRQPAAPVLASEQEGVSTLAPRQRLRALVVDDDAATRGLLREIVSEAGHDVWEATNGEAALRIVLEEDIQIIVADWVMPGLDGLEMTRALRASATGNRIYVLLVTALAEEDRLVEAFEAGIDDYITKPIRPRVLLARLRAALRLIALQQEIEADREEIRRFAADLAITNRRLHEAALNDPLTGLPNRRYAMDRLAQEWTAATRHKRPLACMMIDIDHFKEANDTHGHHVGDLLLKEVSAVIKQTLRGPDVLCRIGGDELLVICPATGREATLACAERLRAAVARCEIKTASHSLRPTISIGVGVREDTTGDFEALVRDADAGLYAAKSGGRNRVGCVQVH